MDQGTMLVRTAEPELSQEVVETNDRPKPMDSVTFAKKMLELGELLTQAAKLETELAEQVLLQGESTKIGRVRAKYSSGRTSYDWERTCREAPGFSEDKKAIYTRIQATEKTDWKRLARVLKVEETPVIARAATPSVNFVLED